VNCAKWLDPAFIEKRLLNRQDAKSAKQDNPYYRKEASRAGRKFYLPSDVYFSALLAVNVFLVYLFDVAPETVSSTSHLPPLT
jgi:hypothetical protein